MLESHKKFLSDRERLFILIGLSAVISSASVQLLIHIFITIYDYSLTSAGVTLLSMSSAGIVIGFLLIAVVATQHNIRLSHLVLSYLLGCFIGGLATLISSLWVGPWAMVGVILYVALIYTPAVLTTLSIISVIMLRFPNKSSIIPSFLSVIIVTLILASILAPSLSQIGTEREWIGVVSLSNNGNKLLIATQRIHSIYKSGVLQIWDLEGKKKVYEKFLKEGIYFDYTLSPSGRYYVAGNSIYNSSTGEEVITLDEKILDWSKDGKYLVIKDPDTYYSPSAGWMSKLLFLTPPSFSVVKEIEIPELEDDKIKLSPRANFFAIWYRDEKMLAVFSVESNMTLWEKQLNLSKVSNICWSNDEKFLQIIEKKGDPNNRSYQIIIFNTSNGEEIQNVILYDDTIKDEYTKSHMVEVVFGKVYFYVYNSYRERGLFFDKWIPMNQIYIYNLTGLNRIISVGGLRSLDVSDSKGLIAVGYDGTVDILNETAGKLIFRIKAPLYRYKKRVPAPDITFLVILSLLVCIMKKKWRNSDA